MKRVLLFILSLCPALPLLAAADFGVDTVSSEWFREWYQWGELQHYLDNSCDVITYMSETTGEWATPEPLLFSINGNSYRWNKYYLDGFRVDSRAQAGDALYRPDMFAHSMQIDYNRGAVYWQTDTLRPQHAQLSGQAGGVGGYSRSAKWLQELQEGNSAINRVHKQETLTSRRHIIGAGKADIVYSIPVKGKKYTQHIQADYGVRQLLRYDYDGITGTYNADYYHAQLDGRLPVASNLVFDVLSYIIRAGYRADGYSEFGYNANEVSHRLDHSFSVYGRKNFARHGQMTTGLTYAIHRDRHREQEFSRNVLDVDGESLEPWYPDGHTHELNWAVNYKYTILPWLTLQWDGYNSLIAFNPSQAEWKNEVYLQGYNMPLPQPLYTYRWKASSFVSGMLENTLSLQADYQVLPWLRLKGNISATVDGILLAGKSLVTPSWEAKADIHIEPVRWFKMDIIAANYRIPYTYEQICFLSDNYMSGSVLYAGSSTLFTSTGGRCHRLGKGLWQPQYVVVDIPFIFTIGRHEISVLSSFKKYYNTWTVSMAEKSDVPYYEVTPAAKTGHGIFDSPVFVSNVVKYAYNGRKVFVSFSWQSYCVSGTSAMGNSMQAEDINVLSESLADPNNLRVETNMQQPDDGIRSLGRLHQDRAYIARLQLGVNITSNWQLSLSGKFRDGVPIRHYCMKVETDKEGHSQVVMWNGYTRGINVVDGNFGQRTDSFFNFDLRLKYRGDIKGVPFSVQAVCYNIWDFATELNEYSMYYDAASGNGFSNTRYPLSLCTPRGLLLTVCVGLDKNTNYR